MPQRIIQTSLEPALRTTLTDAGEPVKLSQATGGVRVRGVQYDEVLFDELLPGPFTDTGIVERPWREGDTATPGRIWLSFGVGWPGPRLQWFEAADVVDVLPL
jgi:hypothetical protein